MAVAPVTPGRLTALWHLLRSLDKLGGSTREDDLLRFGRRSALRSGGLPLVDGLRLARVGHFVKEAAGAIVLAPLGARALALEDEDEPGPGVRRLFLSVLLLRDPPAWVAYWQGDPSSGDLVIPPAQRHLLYQSGLLPVPEAPGDLAAWAFWNALVRVPLPERAGEDRKAIGDAGEEVTVAYERARLRGEGYFELAEQVQWVARESDAYGFDVLSFRGARFSDRASASGATGGSDVATADEPIAIEVKSTSLPATRGFRLFLTVHEWTTAVSLADRYILYLWTDVDPGPPARSFVAEPIVLDAEALTHHVPGGPSCGEDCDWYTARIVFPMRG